MNFNISLGHGVLCSILLVWAIFCRAVQAQDCSVSSPCATGCCNKFGFCGIGIDYCDPLVCVANCDYKSECDSLRPCATGCCSKFGYCGLGPDYCAADVCVSGCDSKSYCDPGGFGEFAEVAKCPLNVCCSKYGFCGLTKEFCGDKKVKRPSCSENGGLNRVVGYYEGWSRERPCNRFYPERIPMGVYTHLNYAFATIDPKTFEVYLSRKYEIDLVERLTALKQIDPDLKVFIAIGGWTFNDPGPTATTFSELAASAEKQKAFFKSLISFMSTYDFDGVDLDWEYPVADDRSGRPEDFENFPRLISNLKKALGSSGGRDGLSITLPASYWYLQHFDIRNLVKDVDFFNIMSYDLHGTWDRGNKWVGPYLNSHTNLTEIANALDLLWRNDINPDKVVLGLAFYARAFTATSSSCLEPGCTFESGANPGKCSREVGILLNSEIKEIMAERNIEPTLDEDAAVKILSFDGNQWLTYDDGDTFQLKANFARSQCLGGVMVWAVSHDTADGEFTAALSIAAARPSAAFMKTPDETIVRKIHDQCKWTNCQEECPKGWTRMMRKDSGARDNEYMVDQGGCDGIGVHQLCCPPSDELPTCGWYTHNNGKCNPSCPTGTTEVGSNSQYCRGSYQAACCTTDTISMALYDQCSWAEAPGCDSGECISTEEIALSTTGSGQVRCDPRSTRPSGSWVDSWTNSAFFMQERKYCCGEEENKKWSDCKWYSDIGPFPAGRGESQSYCRSGCPPDLVRVAMDGQNYQECGGGSRSKCCKANYGTLTFSDDDKRLEEIVKEFMRFPSCGIDDWVVEQPFSPMMSWNKTSNGTHPSSILEWGWSPNGQEKMLDLLSSLIITYTAKKAAQEIWKIHVVSFFPNLSVESIERGTDKVPSWKDKGSSYIVEQIVCNMGYYDAIFGLKSPISCVCEKSDCCPQGDEACSAGEETDITDVAVGGKLEKRAGRRTFSVKLDNGQVLVIRSLPYRGRGEVPANHALMQLGYDFANPNDCMDADVVPHTLTTTTRIDYAVEHIFELNTIRQFITHAHAGTLPSEATPRTPRLTANFLIQALQAQTLPNPPPMAGGAASTSPMERVMNGLGSTRNDGHFVFFLNGLNGIKMQLWRGNNPIAEEDMEKIFDSLDPGPALQNIRMVISIINYLNEPGVRAGWVASANEVRAELARAMEAYAQSTGTSSEPLVAYWDEWLRDFLPGIANRARAWVQNWTRQMHQYWAVRTGPVANQAIEILSTFKSLASDLEIDISGLHQEPVDD
ncbi:hypothetical protein FQN57_004562 [Myotisia sp. PD_48]|nr:hypothetical protein FQN57_004562 [Myotisia sp. PD_48]